MRRSVPGGLMFSSWLRKNGYSAQLLKRYRDSGWLHTLTKGVMYREGDELSALAAIHCYNSQCEGLLRIAAHSALELYGFNHYVPMGKPTLVVSSPTSNMPDWIRNDAFDMNIVAFHTNIFGKILGREIIRNNLILQVSTPELAFLECLHLVPSRYNYMDLYYIMEQLTSLDPIKVQSVLANTNSQKVKRMFLYMAEKAGHYWVDGLDMSLLKLSSSKLKLVDNGTYVSKYKITVPKELYEYE